VIDAQGLRPTPDRVRETLFNWLGPAVPGAHCLDLFAGTGALGLEAASRGAAAVWLVETDRRAREAIADVLRRLDAHQVRLLADPALGALDRAKREGVAFDLAFLDPPFGQGWLARVLPALAQVLKPEARVYVENDQALDPATVALLGPGFRVERADRAGQVFYHLLTRSQA
jgi:16S rRNA (guanine966-N2)-methyltransferase